MYNMLSNENSRWGYANEKTAHALTNLVPSLGKSNEMTHVFQE
jgi:hypothetical protein